MDGVHVNKSIPFACFGAKQGFLEGKRGWQTVPGEQARGVTGGERSPQVDELFPAQGLKLRYTG